MRSPARLPSFVTAFRARPGHYGLAILSVGLSLLLRDITARFLPAREVFLFVPAVVLTGWIGGLGPGLLSTVLNTLTIAYILEPANSLRISSPAERLTLTLFAAMCVLISWLFDSRLRAAQVQAELLQSLDAKTKELEAHQRDLKRSNEDLENFARVAAHDLQEPLRSVHLMADVLRTRFSESLPAGAKECVDLIASSAERMQVLIRDLLAFSMEGAAPQLQASPVEMREVARVAIENLRAAIEETHAIINTGDLPRVEGDAQRLTVVLQNLLSNAIKYRGEQAPNIVIRAESRSRELVFSVGDNGQGFDPKYAQQIFEPFKRLHGRKQAGAGLGLAICRRIVEAHGGRMWAESEPGQGARFYFTLPAAMVRKGAAPEAPKATHAKAG